MSITTVARANPAGLALSPPGAQAVPYISPFQRLLKRGRWVVLASLLLQLDEVVGIDYFKPTSHGAEREIAGRLDKLRAIIRRKR